MLILTFILFITTASLQSMHTTDQTQIYNQAAHDWATQLCTESFLQKLHTTYYSMIFDNEPIFKTNILTQKEKDQLNLLVEHNVWSLALYQKLSSLHYKNPDLAQEHYVQIIAWAFGKKATNFNALHDHHYAVIDLNNKSRGEALDKFMQEHPNLYRRDGKPFLFGLLKKKKGYLLSALLKCGANPNAHCVESGDSVLHELGNMHFRNYSHPGDMDYYHDVITLFKHLINSRNNFGMTPLHEAVGNINLMKVLLEFKGIEIDAQDESGETALHYAAHIFKSDFDTDDKAGKLLLKYGANPDIKNNDGLMYRDILNEKINKFKAKNEFEMES